MLDGQRAIRTVRARAKEWNIDPKKVGIIGFSAGGHLASTLGSEHVLFELVHLGKQADTPKFTQPKRAGWSWNTLVAKGDPAKWILAAGADFDVDLIVMITEGHTSLFDLLRGSTTERVVRGARCPLLAIPA